MSTQDTAIAPNAIAPDTGKPMSKSDTMRFMVGFVIFGIMWMMSGTIGSNVLFPERFNSLNIGMTGEQILASMNTVGMVFALVSNLVFGALSDHCHSRFGKRTPFVLVGGFICGIAFWLNNGWSLYRSQPHNRESSPAHQLGGKLPQPLP